MHLNATRQIQTVVVAVRRTPEPAPGMLVASRAVLPINRATHSRLSAVPSGMKYRPVPSCALLCPSVPQKLSVDNNCIELCRIDLNVGFCCDFGLPFLWKDGFSATRRDHGRICLARSNYTELLNMTAIVIKTR